MQQHKNNNGFIDRLTACVERVGGKRALAAAALISEAQLFRYLNGESDMPSDKLISVAKAAGVDGGWLLTGNGVIDGVKTDGRPSFRSELMVQILQTFEELLIEFDKTFSPRQRARAVTFLYNAMRHEETMRKTTYQPNKFELLKSTNFIAELRTEEELEVLDNAVNLLEYSPSVDILLQNIELLRTWTNLLVRGMKGYYSSYPGQVYFERKMAGQLEAADVLDLQSLVMQSCKTRDKNKLDWLDMGCGNGRHLVHLAKHMPNVRIKGIELSQLGFNLCQELVKAEKLPADSVVMGDMRQLPFSNNSFDVVFAHLSLYCLPYIPGTGLGLEAAMGELSRVLRTDGLAKLTFPMGSWRDYSLPNQYMDEALIEQLIKQLPLKIINTTVEEVAPAATPSPSLPQQLKLNHQRYLHITLQKTPA